ncbi:hypothetical protein GVN24_20375 [Rhizobium sp. CRIBSB]|nr:hypothetical protein [Rhizobium sp. CRIBSB]
MGQWIGWGVGLALIMLVVWGIFAVAGGAGRPRTGSKGGSLHMMAAMMLGLGAPIDPPQRHVLEAKDEAPRGSPETGEPELDD